MSLDINLDDDPIEAMRRWYRDAEGSLPSDEAHAIALATVDAQGGPSVRVVLARSIRDDGGLLFYTNYDSRKGRELDETKRGAAVFHWWKAGRQCRVEGPVERCSAQQSDAYWLGRPRGSRISALASPQSQAIEGFDVLERKAAELEREFEGKEIPRPDWWGGYVLVPQAIEFWARGDARLHERLRFERSSADAPWSGQRIGP